MKILIVEDDRNYRAMLFEFLNTRGHDVLAVSDALHAVALLGDHSHEIALVLLDLKMPRLSGDELMDSFAYWSTCTTRFLIVSGANDLEKYQGHPKLAGILHKPFELKDLEAAITAEAKRREAADKASSGVK
jgi:two-component system OmpR family response regulator